VKKEQPCIYCGYPTRHDSQTCGAHRDLAPPIERLEVDAALEQRVTSPDDDTASGVGGAGVAESVAADPDHPSRIVDR
jgi:hypothetical protein